VLWQSFQSLGHGYTALIISHFFRVCRSRLRSVKTGFWQHSDSDAISNRNRLLDANCWDNEASMQTYMMADAHHRSNAKSCGRMKPRLCIGIKTVQNCQVGTLQNKGWLNRENLYRWYSQRRIFGINLVFKNGRERAERMGVQEVTGKAPRRFENFARDYATMFRPQEFNKAP